jgi:hypothetical protein
MKKLIKNILEKIGYRINSIKKNQYCEMEKLEKASIYIERYREIVSDPLNLMISRVPEAGYVDKSGNVILHNGHRVPVYGPLAYYSEFSDILIINRGVHEPLEEFCFQALLKKIKIKNPKMLELGAYWAHYSMWLLKEFPGASCFLVEPDKKNIECGRNNFNINNYKGEFIQDFVGSCGFKLDEFMSERKIENLEILHSDIQGYELEMIEGGQYIFRNHRVSYIFISTHSNSLHKAVEKSLISLGYVIEVSSGEEHTTSGDGFIMAHSPKVVPIFDGFSPLGRVQIAKSNPKELLNSLVAL